MAPEVRERERELAALHAATQRAARGDGGVVLVEGPAGIGKTALLRTTRARAADAGMQVLRATASPLERDLPFGLVRQLLEPALASAPPEERRRLVSGGAARAAVVFATGAPTAAEPDPSHAVLRGLYWLVVALAEPRPLALVVDDLHWADRASLRFLELLGRRLEGVGILVVGGIRTGDPDADAELLSAIATGPAAQTLRPAPLSPEAVAELLAAQLGTTPGDSFAHAAHEATGGNPFLLGQLARAAEERGMSGDDGDAAQVPGLGARDVAEAVTRRLATLGPAATAVARAGTILPEPWEHAELTALVTAAHDDLGPHDVETALDRLAGGDLLTAGRRAFLHPLVREAVASRLPSADAGHLHAIAARQGRERGVRPATIAAHLLLTPPANDPQTVATLRDAARAAKSEGAPEAAIQALRRALAEPPPPDERGAVLLELGETEALVADPAAAGRLDAALRELEPGDGTARAHAARARLHLLSNMALGLDEFEAGLVDARDPKLRLRLEGLLLEATAYDGALAHHRAALLDTGVRDPDASPVMLAHLAQESAYRCEPVQTSERLVQAALDGGLLEAIGPDTGTYHLAALAMRHAELPQVVDRILTAGEQGVRRTGSIMGRWYMEHARALWHLMFGSLADAEAHARTALTVADDVEMLVVRFSSVVAVADILVARGQPAEARALLDSIHAPKGVQSGMTWPDRLAVTAELHVLDGNLAAAEEELRHALALLRERGWRAPFKAGAGLRLAAVLAAQERYDEARAVAEEEAEAARRAGIPGALGAALRARAQGLPDAAERVEQLEEAVAILRTSQMPTERAHALADLGEALRAADRPDEAREVLREALETAEERGATRLATRARHALVELGARPRRAAVRGVDALTPSERRVAGLAASGMTNREIAEALFVTRKTVELHLGHAYAKLGIKSRAQLPEELATVPA